MVGHYPFDSIWARKGRNTLHKKVFSADTDQALLTTFQNWFYDSPTITKKWMRYWTGTEWKNLDVGYTAGSSARWTVPAPENVSDALDRLAGAGPFENVLTVAKSGAQFTTIQTAIDAIPSDLYHPVLIIVYPGTYNENLVLNNESVSLTIMGYSFDDSFDNMTIIQCSGGNLFTFNTPWVTLVLKNLYLNCGFIVDENYNEIDPGSDFSIFYDAHSDDLPLYSTHWSYINVVDCIINIQNLPGTLYLTSGSPYKAYIIKNKTDDDPFSNTLGVYWKNVQFHINESHNYGVDWAYIKCFERDASFTDCYIGFGWSDEDFINGNQTTFFRDYNNNSSWSYIRPIRFIGCEIGFSHHHSETYYTTKKLYHHVGKTCDVLFDSCNFKMSNTTYGRAIHASCKSYICYLDSANVAYGNIRFFHNTVQMDGVTNVYQKQLIILKKPAIAPSWNYINYANQFSLATFVESGNAGVQINDGVPEDVTTSSLQFGDSGTVGGLNTFARAKHTHGMPRNPIVYASQAPTNPVEGDFWVESARQSNYPNSVWARKGQNTLHKKMFSGDTDQALLTVSQNWFFDSPIVTKKWTGYFDGTQWRDLDCGYTPEISADWQTVPETASAALDRLAARIRISAVPPTSPVENDLWIDVS